jgi:hypothetical protein
MQNNEFLKTVKTGDFVIQNFGFTTREVLVRDVIGNIIEVTNVDVREDIGEPPNALELDPYCWPFCNYFSVHTGGDIDIKLGLDGHEPGPDHPFKCLWSQLISKA